MNMIKKISSIFILGCMLLGLVSCNNSNTSWIAEYNDEKLEVGVYIQSLMEGYRQLYIRDLMGETTNSEAKSDNKYKIGKSKEEDSTEAKKISILNKTVDGKKGSDWIIDNAKEKIWENIAVDNKFKEMNLELNKEKVDYVERNLLKEWDALDEQQGYEKKGISMKSILKALINSMKKQEIFNAYYAEGGLQEVTDAQIKEYLKEKYNKVKYFSFELYGLDDKEKVKKEKLYDEFLKRVKAGEDMDALIKEFDKKEYALEKGNQEESKVDQSDDNGSSENEMYDVKNSNMKESGYDHTSDEEDETVAIYKKENSGEFTKDIQEAIDKADIGKITGFKGKDELIVFIRKDPSDSKDYIEKNKDNLLNEIKSEDFEKEIKNWVDINKIKYNQDAINKYTPEKLKLDK